MSSRDEEFQQALQATFKVEAAEHVEAIAAGLIGLEKSPAPEVQRELVATVFRAAHSLKGAARAVDHTDVESCCQTIEDLFATWRKKPEGLTREALDAAHRGLDAINSILGRSSAVPVEEPAVVPVESPAMPAPAPAVVPVEPARSGAGETVRISVEKLEARLIEAEEMLAAKLTIGQRASDLRDLARRIEAWREDWTSARLAAHTLRRNAERNRTRVDPDLNRLLDFFDRNRDQLKAFEGSVAGLARVAQQDHHEVGKLVDDLLDDSKKLLLLPFATLTVSFPKLVRDLCRDQGKEAELVIRGEAVELDKRVLEEMKDPFIHLLRNCVDHGIERPEERVRLGKPARATLSLSAAPLDGNKVELIVSDDGGGIDPGKVKAAAVKHGHLTAEEADRMSAADALELIFRPEVSTSPMITKLSGRGLGMTIVRERAEKLGGSVTVESRPGQGTRFRLVLPSLLATFRGILVEVAQQRCVIPTAQVARVGGIRPAEVRTVEGRETVALDGRLLPLVRLSDVLGLLATERDPAAKLDFLVLGTGEQSIAFVVDAVLDEHEVLVKPFRRPLVRVRHFAGATVLGSGRVAPVLHAGDLLHTARGLDGRNLPRAAAPVPAKPAAVRSVLVAEDSITSRMLIKGMLESAGYRVTVAADGMEAFTHLRSGGFDLLVSDVEMPRLNGFDLTARIRADRKLAELPVVLVTALETREDRERGIDVGANAYIVKSNLDQSNLLDAVRRLI
jgi:two-component system chemotaxis sensor kinase CheA